MDRKKKPNGLLISGLISALASLAIVAVAPSFAGDNDPGKEKPSQASQSGASDHDGDADSDENTSLEDSHEAEPDAAPSDNEHPSGKDRSAENGGSGNQGKAESNPDDSKGPMRYEGAQGDDKPGGPGGGDLEDQDGNNGCGNDDDFDDDNNGHCGAERDDSQQTCPDGSAMPASGRCDTPSDSNDVKGNKTCPDGATMVQGKSCSEPDNDGRGPDRNESGRDKVEDGNNGCGNDADRMDDSEGWCGKPKDDAEVLPTILCPDGSEMPAGGNCGEGVPCPAGTTMDAAGNCLEVNPSVPEQVLGEQITKDEAKPEGPSVLGVKLSPALNEPVEVAGAVLPFTGGDVLLFLALALSLFASGALIMRSTKGRTNN